VQATAAPNGHRVRFGGVVVGLSGQTHRHHLSPPRKPAPIHPSSRAFG